MVLLGESPFDTGLTCIDESPMSSACIGAARYQTDVTSNVGSQHGDPTEREEHLGGGDAKTWSQSVALYRFYDMASRCLPFLAGFANNASLAHRPSSVGQIGWQRSRGSKPFPIVYIGSMELNLSSLQTVEAFICATHINCPINALDSAIIPPSVDPVP